MLGRIGGGGMGEVFRAWDYRLDRQVALKVPLEASQRPREVLDRFRIEVEAVERLNHENLCKLLDHDVGHVPPFLTMEYLEGGSLKDRVIAYAESSVAEVLGQVRTLALGLEHAPPARGRPSRYQADERPVRRRWPAAHRRFRPGALDRPAARRPDHRGASGPRVLALHVARAGRRLASRDRSADRHLLAGHPHVPAVDGGLPLSRPGQRSQPFLDRAGDPRRPDRGPVVAAGRPGWSDRRRLPQGDRAGPGTAIPLHERDGRRGRRTAGHPLVAGRSADRAARRTHRRRRLADRGDRAERRAPGAGTNPRRFVHDGLDRERVRQRDAGAAGDPESRLPPGRLPGHAGAVSPPDGRRRDCPISLASTRPRWRTSPGSTRSTSATR